jgi:hypothetical protein
MYQNISINTTNINYNENPLPVLDLLYEDRRFDTLGEGKREMFVTFGC